MEIRDPVHGSIQILKEEIPILESRFFQRLRNIKQLGFSEFVFPGATHTRYLHSIGVMYLAGKAFDKLFAKYSQNKELFRLKETLKIACLLHDIGHAPLSHSSEWAMPSLNDLSLPPRYLKGEKNLHRQATHEDYTIKSIVDSSLTDTFKTLEANFGVNYQQVADLILGHTQDPQYFILDQVNYFPLLAQMVSGEMDCDRMDYLLRDSYFCGVSYGKFDLDWIIDNLRICSIDGSGFLGISERAISTFDDFLLSRFHMFLMVYFHYRPVCLEQLLIKYLTTSPEEYKIPYQIEEYCQHDDYFLRETLRSSKNEYAQQIIRNAIPPKIFEAYGKSLLNKLNDLEKFLVENQIEYIKCSSNSRLSKYYNNPSMAKKDLSMKVVRSFYGSKKSEYKNLEDATDVYHKYKETHTVNRIYCYLGKCSSKQQKLILEIISS